MKAWMAVIETPRGVWESTATVCTGHEAEFRARQYAWNKFMAEAIPDFMTKGLDGLRHSFERAAQSNGCRAIVTEVELSTAQDK